MILIKFFCRWRRSKTEWGESKPKTTIEFSGNAVFWVNRLFPRVFSSFNSSWPSSSSCASKAKVWCMMWRWTWMLNSANKEKSDLLNKVQDDKNQLESESDPIQVWNDENPVGPSFLYPGLPLHWRLLQPRWTRWWTFWGNPIQFYTFWNHATFPHSNTINSRVRSSVQWGACAGNSRKWKINIYLLL